MFLMDDLRFAVRRLWKSPGFTIAAILTLAVGIGANAALFTAVRAVLLRPLPYRDADRLVVIWQRNLARNLPVVEVSYGDFLEWRSSTRTLQGLAVMGSVNWDMLLDERGEPARIPAAAVSASFFDVLGVRPAHGRSFDARDDVANAARTVILSHGLWQRRFGGDADVLGSTIALDGERFSVVGIMPPEFDYPAGAQLWTPVLPILAPHEAKSKGTLANLRVLYAIGRLAGRVTTAQATAELDAIVRRISSEWHSAAAGPAVSLTRVPDQILGQTRAALLVLSGTVMLVLLVACANVAGLVLTRAASKSREVAMKRALGASTGRLLADCLAETCVLALAAGAASVGLAFGSARMVSLIAPADVPRLGDMRVDAGVMAFAFGVAGLSALVCALPPAWHALSPRLIEALGSAAWASENRRTRRIRQALVVAEVAAALVLLVGAGLMVRSFAALRSLDLGFQPARILTVDVDPLVGSQAEWRRAFDAILRRVRAVPGVEAAGSVFLRPLAHGPIGLESGFLFEGQSGEQRRENPFLNFQTVTPGYFGVMGIGLRRGRYFSADDTASTPAVIVIGQRTADRLWPGQDPIGRRISVGGMKQRPNEPDTWQTVVGVVGDVRYRALDDVRLDVYVSAAQSPNPAPHLVVRTAGDPSSAASAVRAAIREAAPRSVVEQMRTMEGIVDNAMAPWRFSMTLFVALAAIAVALAAVGLFAVVALTVAQRTREIAVRVAVGATPSRVLAMLMWHAAKIATFGVTLGTAAALALVRLMRGLLFQVEPSDPATFACVSALLISVALAASYVAARRVTAIDPIRALRAE